MGEYGLGAPGSHQTGPVVSEHGFRTGKKGNTTEVVNSNGQVVGTVTGSVEGDLNSAKVWEAMSVYEYGVGGLYDKTDAGTITLFGSGAAGTRELLIVLKVTTTFTAADEPTYEIKQSTGDVTFVADDHLHGSAEDSVYTFTFTGDDAYDNETDLQLVVGSAAGDGAISVMVFLGPLVTPE